VASSPPPVIATSPPVVVSPSASTSAAPPPVEPTGPVLELEGASWSPDRALIATVYEARAHLWDGAKKAHVRLLYEGTAREVIFSPDGKRIFIAMENDPPVVCNRDGSGARSFDLAPGINPESDRGEGMISLSPDGAWLVGRCNTVQVCLWNTRTGKARQWLQPTKKDAPSELSSVAFADNGKRIVVKTESGSTYRIDAASLH
jgi:WD40 repeat protein